MTENKEIDTSFILLRGERVFVKLKPEECKKTVSPAASCEAIGRIGTVFFYDEKMQRAQVIFDEPFRCENERDFCYFKLDDIEPFDHRIIIGFVKEFERALCLSKGCGKNSYYIVIDYMNQRIHHLCATHAIEWLNDQYHAVADVTLKAIKEMKNIKKETS